MFFNFRNLIKLKVIRPECQIITKNMNSEHKVNTPTNGTSNNNKWENGTSAIIKCSDSAAVELAAHQLRISNVIALPTDTVYGLACSANNREAIQKLYDIKGRKETNPVCICVATIKDLRYWGEADHLSDDLLNQLLPGAVTIVLNRSKHLDNPFLNKGVATIGIRIPDFNFIREVSRLYGFPIALSSANRSAEKSTIEIDEFRSLWPKLGAVFDGGRIGLTEEQRAASTIVNLSKPGVYKIHRNGIAVKNTIKVIEEFGNQLDED